MLAIPLRYQILGCVWILFSDCLAWHPGALPLQRSHPSVHTNRGSGPCFSHGYNRLEEEPLEEEHTRRQSSLGRRQVLAAGAALWLSSGITRSPPAHAAAAAKCRDLESCREIGEQKDMAKAAATPIVRLGGGLQYKVLTAGLGNDVVTEESKTVKIAYSIAAANGSYMYSRGFGFNQIDAGNGRQVSDLGLDGLVVSMRDAGSRSSSEQREVPVGIRQALMGMKRGEKRRIECPPSLGFETSDWKPVPTTYRGQRQIVDYKNRLYGRGTSQPPFPSPTIWDVEVLSLR
jgi:hypothetical protein